jgi:hypothetical protein
MKKKEKKKLRVYVYNRLCGGSLCNVVLLQILSKKK